MEIQQPIKEVEEKGLREWIAEITDWVYYLSRNWLIICSVGLIGAIVCLF
jgi:hypothetical protein